jgi:hypothetical protein
MAQGNGARSGFGPRGRGHFPGESIFFLVPGGKIVLILCFRNMSPFFATFLTGLVLIAIGVPLLVSNSLVVTTIKAMPRSPAAAALFWGVGSLWFLHMVWNLPAADLVIFETSKPLAVFFAVIAVTAFYYVPDFLAIRGLSVITLLAAWEILMGTFGEYGWLLVGKACVYIAIVLAIYFGCVPYRARDFIQWLFNRVRRARALGALLLACGLLLAGMAFAH